MHYTDFAKYITGEKKIAIRGGRTSVYIYIRGGRYIYIYQRRKNECIERVEVAKEGEGKKKKNSTLSPSFQ